MDASSVTIAAILLLATAHTVTYCHQSCSTFRDLYCHQCQGLCRAQQDTGPSGDDSGCPLTTELSNVERIVERKLNEKCGFLFAPRNCESFSKESAKSLNDTGGVIDVFIPSYFNTTEVYCDDKTDGGDWIVFQRRMNGEVDFFRDWKDYATGFGQRDREFWLGLETIHQLTKIGNTEMRIDMIERSGKKYYAKYSSFHVGPASDNYRLHIGGYSGNATDSIWMQRNTQTRLNNQQFSTRDADNDQSTRRHCAEIRKAGWWYNDCMNANLNGKYDLIDLPGIAWYHHTINKYMYMTFTEMKFRSSM